MSHSDSSAAREFVARHAVGDVLDGRVTKVVPFGAFIEVADGVHGLMPKAEWINPPEFGDALAVRILAVDTDQGRFSLAPA